MAEQVQRELIARIKKGFAQLSDPEQREVMGWYYKEFVARTTEFNWYDHLNMALEGAGLPAVVPAQGLKKWERPVTPVIQRPDWASRPPPEIPPPVNSPWPEDPLKDRIARSLGADVPRSGSVRRPMPYEQFVRNMRDFQSLRLPATDSPPPRRRLGPLEYRPRLAPPRAGSSYH